MILIDTVHNSNPALNLAIEEFTVRNLPVDVEYLIIYRNSPCIVIGKNQNVFEEVDLKYCARNKIPIFRRISGGGAVYHDLGNINCSFISLNTMQKYNNYAYFVTPVVKMLQQLGIPAVLDKRNNITANGKKVSGNAQFSSRDRLLSHGTLLYSSDVGHLKNSLSRKSHPSIKSNAAKSQPASVINIADLLENPWSPEEFQDRVKRSFAVDKIYRFSKSERRAIEILSNEKYGAWDWNYGCSPASVVDSKLGYKRADKRGFATVILKIDKGLIHSAKIISSRIPREVSAVFSSRLYGIKYEFQSLSAAQIDLNNELKPYKFQFDLINSFL